MTTIRQLLDQKGRDTWSTHPDATVLEAAAKMAEKNIGSLTVMDGGTFLGIITERHVARNTATLPRTVAAPLVLPPAVDLVTVMAPARTNPNAAFECPSQPPLSRCCDDRLKLPSFPQ